MSAFTDVIVIFIPLSSPTKLISVLESLDNYLYAVQKSRSTDFEVSKFSRVMPRRALDDYTSGISTSLCLSAIIL